jgi:hypothetical protein
MVIILPIPTLIKLKKHRPEVKQLIGLILLGSVHTALTVARFVIMFYPSPLTKTEPQYAHVMPNCLAVVEMDIGIWVATLVVMRPAFQVLYRAWRPNHKSEPSTSYYYKQSGTGKDGNEFRLRNMGAMGKKREDGFRILETTEIQVLSEAAETSKAALHSGDRNAAQYDREKTDVYGEGLGYRGSIANAGMAM